MAAEAGRKLRIKLDLGSGAVAVVGAQTDNFTINNEPIDITDKDDLGIQTLLNGIGKKSFEMTAEGVLKDAGVFALVQAAADGTSLHAHETMVGGLGTLAGTVFLGSFQASGAEGPEAITFTVNMMSSGAQTWTPTP